MARKNRTPEENARREKIRELLQMANIDSMDDIQNLFKETIAEFMEEGLEAELDEELGYSKYDYKNKETDNSRNGHSSKRLRTSFGEVDVSVPRDRMGEFEPQVLKKNQTSIRQDIEEKILSMYAKGMTTGDIETHIQEIYGISVSDSTVSRITDKILSVAREWQQRPLESIYAVVLPSRKILGKKGKVWYHKRYGIYRFKESREIRTQGDTQAGRTAQENGKNGKRNRGINRSTAESRKRNMDSVSTRGRKFAGAKKVRTKAGQPHGPYSGRTRKYPKGNRREDTGGFRDHRQAVDIGTDAAVHSEAVSQGNKRANTVGLHEALGHELPASSEACPEAESYRHLKVEKRGISRNFKACGGGECHNLLGR